MVKKRYTLVPGMKRARKEPVWEYATCADDINHNGKIFLIPDGSKPTAEEIARAKRVGGKIYSLRLRDTSAAEFVEEIEETLAKKYPEFAGALREERAEKERGWKKSPKMSPFDEWLHDTINPTHLLYMAKYIRDRQTSSTSDEKESSKSEADQKTSSTKDEEKTTVADEQEINSGTTKESKKAMVASSEVDPPISKDLSSFAAGDCPELAEVENVNKIDQVDSPGGEFHISFESEDCLDVVKTSDEPIPLPWHEQWMQSMVASSEVDPPLSKDLSSFAAGDCPEVTEVEDVNKIDQVDSPSGESHISLESGDSPDVIKRDGPIPLPWHEKWMQSMGEGEAELSTSINEGMRRGFLLPQEPNKAPISKNADSLVLNDCIPSIEAGAYPNMAETTSAIESLLPNELHLSSSVADDYPEVPKTRDEPVKGEEDEEEWHDEDTHGSFNPADPKCKCAIS